MKRRIFSLALVIASSIVYACSSSSNDTSTTPTPTPPTPTPDSGTTPDSSTDTPDAAVADTGAGDGTVPPNSNPIEGIAAPVSVAAFTTPAVIYTEGPQWRGDSLYLSEAKPDGHVLKFNPALPASLTNPVEVRAVLTPGSTPLGTTFDERGNSFITCEVSNGTAGGQLVRTPPTGLPDAGGTAILLTTDGGTPPKFDSPNDIVARKSDGTLYVTDPGYQTAPLTNHLWRVKPVTGEVFETPSENRPNGIALSPDEKTLYVSFTDAPSKVVAYPIALDGAIGVGVPFVALLPGDATADGLAVDSSGNVYVAVKDGVDVFKPDAVKWGHIQVGKIVNGLAFGGADKKTLFMTSESGLFTATVKIPGLLQ